MNLKQAGWRFKRQTAESLTAYALIAIVIVLAWLPLYGPYYPVADDFPLSAQLDSTSFEYFRNWFNSYGVWRILGPPWLIITMNVPSIISFVVVVGLQTVMGLLLFRLLRSLLENDSVALLFSILVAAFPCGAGAIVWASAFWLVPSTVLFLCVMLICRNAGRHPGSQLCALIASSLISLISLLIQENHLLALAVSGTIAWIGIDRRRGIAHWCRETFKHFSAWGPLLGCVVYFILYQLSKQATSHKTVSVNPESVLSAMLYQYTLLDAFRVWCCPSAVQHLFRSMTMVKGSFAVVLAVVIAVLVWLRSRKLTDRPEENIALDPFLLLYGAVLLFLTGAIFAIAGGFSLDSRKKYMMLIPHAILWSALLGPALLKMQNALIRKSRMAIPILEGMFVALGVFTTWLLISLWHFRVEAHQQLLDLLVAKQLAQSAVIVETPDSSLNCPVLNRFWGFDFEEEWVLDLGLKSRGVEGWTETSAEHAAVIISFDPVSETWQIQPSHPVREN